MRILIVGAGAVGQVYARHLQRGGAQVGVFVREKYAQACQDGLTLYPLNEGRPPGCRDTLDGLEVLTSPEQVQRTSWDQLWLCVSSTGLRGAWLKALLSAADGAAVITLQPGLEDRQLLLQHVREENLITGLITFIAWQAPLPGEPALDEPGIMYWMPPLTPLPFSGPDEPTQKILKTLRSGGVSARAVRNLPEQMAITASAMSPAMAALETAGWSLRQFRRSSAARLAADAARQSMTIAAAYHNQRAPLAAALLPTILLRAGALVAPACVPFDLERYLQYHFTKVGDQTRDALQTTIRNAQQHSLPADAVQRLLDALDTATEAHRS